MVEGVAMARWEEKWVEIQLEVAIMIMARI